MLSLVQEIDCISKGPILYEGLAPSYFQQIPNCKKTMTLTIMCEVWESIDQIHQQWSYSKGSRAHFDNCTYVLKCECGV